MAQEETASLQHRNSTDIGRPSASTARQQRCCGVPGATAANCCTLLSHYLAGTPPPYELLTGDTITLDRIADIRTRSCERYSKDNALHSSKLLQLWSLAEPGKAAIPVVSPEWRTIGFQADDPSTDFRGAGVMGLDCLLYVANHHGVIFEELLRNSRNKERGPYTLACVALNVSGRLQAHFGVGNPDVKLMPLKLYACQSSRVAFAHLIGESPDAFEEMVTACLRLVDVYWAAECLVHGPERLDLFNAAIDKMQERLEEAMLRAPHDLEDFVTTVGL